MSHSLPGVGSDAGALTFARKLYDKYFSTQLAFHRSTGDTLLELYQKIEQFERQKGVLVPAEACIEIFSHLTCGLHGTLEDLDEELGVSESSGGKGHARPGESFNTSNLLRISETQEKLCYYAVTIDIIVNAIKRKEIEIANSNSAVRQDDLQHLRILLDKFFQGSTQIRGWDTGGILPADPVFYSQRQWLQKITQTLQAQMEVVATTIQPEDNLSIWKMRHALYWYSISSASASIKSAGLHVDAKALLDGIKSAWLLHDALQSSSSMPLLGHVAVVLEERLLGHLYRDSTVLENPDYQMIIRHADLSISMPLLGDQVLGRGVLILETIGSGSIVTSTDDLHSRSLCVSANLSSSANNRLKAKPITSPQSPPKGAVDRHSTRAIAYRSRNIRKKAPEGASSCSKAPHKSSSTPEPSQQQAVKSPQRPEIFLSGTLLPRLQKETQPSLLPELSIPDDKICPPDSVEKIICSREPPTSEQAPNAPSGFPQEQVITFKNLEDVQASDEETEVENRESGDGFQHTIFAAQRATASGGRYEAARIRIFRNGRTKRLRLWTSLAESPLHRCDLDTLCDELVPLYAWEDNIEDGSELYLRHRGEQHGLHYKFHPKPDRMTDLYGFQGAITRADFEGEYRVIMVRTVNLNRTPVPNAENPKVQVWTELEDSWSGDMMSGALHSQDQSPARERHTETFSVNVDNLISKVPCSKIFVFSGDKIFVVLVTDRTRLEVVTKHPRWRAPPPATKIQLVPNKERGCTHVRYRTLQPSRGKSAGIPLNHNGIHYADQDTSKFEDCRSIIIEFNSPDNCANFVDLYNELFSAWKARCAPFLNFRDIQRERKVTAEYENVIAEKPS